MDTPEISAPDWKFRRKVAFIFLGISAAAYSGLSIAYYTDARAVQLIQYGFLIAMTLGVALWCRFDSGVIGFDQSVFIRMAILLFGPIGVAGYFAQSRPIRQALRSVFGLWIYGYIYGVLYLSWFIGAEIYTRIFPS